VSATQAITFSAVDELVRIVVYMIVTLGGAALLTELGAIHLAAADGEQCEGERPRAAKRAISRQFVHSHGARRKAFLRMHLARSRSNLPTEARITHRDDTVAGPQPHCPAGGQRGRCGRRFRRKPLE
jgi:hypothetical protein